MSLLRGPVAFIDDQIHMQDKAAFAMKAALEADGRPVSTFDKLPDTSAIEHWQSLSFLVLDWDLSPGSFGGVGASTLGAYARESLFEFLEHFMNTVFCPIFIVSAEDISEIERQLKADTRFGGERLDTRIKIFGKSAVVGDLLRHLDDWVSQNLALSVLRVWEREYEQAKNRLFIDFNDLDPSWPTYIWRNAMTDKIEPAFELASTLTHNLLHRLDVVKFDTETLLAATEDTPLSGSATRRVMNGRTVIPGKRLHGNVVMPGDIFQDESDEEVVWLNLTPACHTVPGRLADDSDLRLYAIPGRKQAYPTSNSQFNRLNQESPNSFTVHVLHAEAPYTFDLKAAQFLVWQAVREHRLGRLLSPYITRAQQWNAMFMQVEGIPRASWDLYKE